jgi:hypothetical protein
MTAEQEKSALFSSPVDYKKNNMRTDRMKKQPRSAFGHQKLLSSTNYFFIFTPRPEIIG